MENDRVRSEKMLVGERAADYIKDGMVVGLGTGSTVYYTIMKVGRMVQDGLQIKAVSTSTSTSQLAKKLGIPLVGLDEVKKIDVTIDGADEVDPMFRGIKGGGGALLFEKIVASCSRRNIWVVDSSKYVKRLGTFKLPVEVIPFGHTQVLRKMTENSFECAVRMKEENIFYTDSGNMILDMNISRVEDYDSFNQWLLGTPGVVETGLFLDIVDEVILPDMDGVKIIKNQV